jgi:hypothetical protein
MNYLDEVYKQTADGGYFDFTRCQRPNGTIYGTSGKCKSGTEIGAKEAAGAPQTASAAQKPAKLGGAKVGSEKRLLAFSVGQLKQLREDPRLYDYQKKKLDSLIAKKESEGPKPTTAAAKNARPVDPKVAAKVNKAMAAKAKGPQYTPEQIAAQNAALRKNHEDIANEVMADKKLRSDKARKAEMVRRGVPANTDFVALVADAKERRVEKAEAERQAGLKMSKADRKADIRRQIEDLPNQWYGKDVASITQSINTLKYFIKSEKSLDTIDNRNKLVALRALRMKYVAAEQAKRRAMAVDAQSAIKGSPTYTSTPGSARPLPNAAKKLGGNAKEYTDKKRRIDELDAKLAKLEKLPWEEKKKAGYQQLDDERLTLKGELIRLERSRDFLPLAEIYKAQGFNAKPELVATRGDLERRTDLAKGIDGKPVIAFRGVTEQKFADQFRGLGAEGETHYAGVGIYGNGTYAAATAPNKTREQSVRTSQQYAGSAEGTNARVTAFGFRSDANLVIPQGETQNERFDNYVKWQLGIVAAARNRTGLPINDTGHAAAIMGVHAYQVPVGYDEDYWVVLNRGATIQAIDAQI